MNERALVMRGGALGDFVLGLPALAALRGALPDAALELVAPSAVLPLASPLVDVATPLEPAEMASLFDDSSPLPEPMIRRYRDLDLVVLWMADREGAVRRNFERLGARRVLWAPALPSEPGRHAADHLMETLRPLGVIPIGPALPVVQPGEAAREAAESLRLRLGLAEDSPTVAIHPGSGGARKLWPAERFAAVVDALARTGDPVVMIQGPADEKAMGEMLAEVREAPPQVATDLGVEELAAFLAGCRCYLGNDSGVTHLAAAAGAPTVAIFGPTDPAVWGPRGRRVGVLRAEEGWPSTAEAMEAVRAMISGE